MKATRKEHERIGCGPAYQTAGPRGPEVIAKARPATRKGMFDRTNFRVDPSRVAVVSGAASSAALALALVAGIASLGFRWLAAQKGPL